eukprot:4411443-Lingulodinium_polyedra.AAC.1
MEPSLKACAQTAQTPVVGRIKSCASGTGNAVGPCDATDTRCCIGKLSSTLPLPKDGPDNARDDA